MSLLAAISITLKGLGKKNVTNRRDYPRHKNIIKGLGKIMSLLVAIFITLKGWERPQIYIYTYINIRSTWIFWASQPAPHYQHTHTKYK